ncbi:hypothetical protein [Streptomyces sp. NPDC005336]|uniref:hypothetical protein n=1 Tax=Streptomyces sp. NPDC005336 TaxID=3157035 RepID=UPI0033B405FF
MGQGRILNRGARVFGALVCAVLGLISLAWIIRDLDKADEASDLWWAWSGLPFRASGSIFGSSLLDLVLLVVYVAVGIAALRSPAAAGALGTVAVVTVALRLPSLWNLNADWMQGVPDDLKTRANLSVWVGVVLGGLLLATVAAARRPADLGPYPASPADQPPARPGPGAAVTAALSLGAVGAVIGAWQIYWAQERGWVFYKYLLTGKHTLATLLSAPGAWSAWASVALCLAAAVAAPARAPLSRPLGMTAAALVLTIGISEVSLCFKLEYVDHLGDLPTVGVLSVLSAFFEAAAGLIALVALARRGVGADEAPLGGPPRPEAPAYGGGYGYGAGGYGDSGGYGGGGYAPPPPATPPPPAPAPPSSPPPAPPPAPPPGW